MIKNTSRLCYYFIMVLFVAFFQSCMNQSSDSFSEENVPSNPEIPGETPGNETPYLEEYFSFSMPNRCLAGSAFSVSDFHFVYVNPENTISLNDVTADELRKNGIAFQIDISFVDENLNFIDSVGNIGSYSEELHIFPNAGTFTLKVSGFVGGLEFCEHRTVTITKEPDTPVAGNEMQVFLDVLDINVQEYERLASDVSSSTRITLTSQIIKLLGDVYSGTLMGRDVEWFPNGDGRYYDDYFEYSCLEEISDNIEFVKTYYFSHRQGNDGMQNPFDLSDFVKAFTALKNGWIKIERGKNIIVKDLLGIIIDDCVPYYTVSGNILCIGAFIDNDLQIENSGNTELAFSEDCRFYSNYYSYAISEEDVFGRFNRILPQSKRVDATKIVEIVLATESEIPSYESLPSLSYKMGQLDAPNGHWIVTLYKIYIKNNKRDKIELTTSFDDEHISGTFYFTGFNKLHNYTLFKGNEQRIDVRIPRIPIDVIALGDYYLQISNCIIEGDCTEEGLFQDVSVVHFTNVIFEGDVNGIDQGMCHGVVWFKGKPFDGVNGIYTGGNFIKISCPREHFKEWIEDNMQQSSISPVSYNAIDLTEYDITYIETIFSNHHIKLDGDGPVTYLKSSDKNYAENFIKEHGKPLSVFHADSYIDTGRIFFDQLMYGVENVYINGKPDSFDVWLGSLPEDENPDNKKGVTYRITEKNVGAILNAYETRKGNLDGFHIYDLPYGDRSWKFGLTYFPYQIPYERLLEEWEYYGNFETFKKGVDKKEFYREIVELYERESEYGILNKFEESEYRCVYEEAKRRAGL